VNSGGQQHSHIHTKALQQGRHLPPAHAEKKTCTEKARVEKSEQREA